MRITFDVRFVAATWCLLVVGQSGAQDDVKLAADEPLDLPAAPTVTSKVISRTYGISHHLTSAIDRLPDSFRSDPGHRGLIDELQRLTKRVDYLDPRREPPNERRLSLQRIAKSVGDLVNSESPQDQVAPLVDVAAQLLAQLYLESETDGDWGTKVLSDLAQLETRLGNEFSSQLEVAATVGLERLKITSIPKLGSHPDYYWKEGPIATTAFLKKYSHTIAAAQAAVLLASAYEAAQNSPAGLPLPAEGQYREPTRRWYHLAIEQAPDSLWGKIARGCLNRLDLVGQTLQVSGKSLDGKPLSLEQFRGKPTVVAFFRPGKTSWGAAENPTEFGLAVRQRGFEALGVLCYSPTAAPDEIVKFLAPKTSADSPQDPVIVDTTDVDTSYSVRYGLIFPRLFVLVDQTGKVVRTALTEIKDLNEFLGVPADHTDHAMKVYLQRGIATEIKELLQSVFAGAELSADEKQNSIMIRAADKSQLGRFEALVNALDKAGTGPAESTSQTRTPQTAESPTPQRTNLVFTATWSSPCQQVLPILRSIAEQGAPIQFVDVDRDPELAKQHQITSIPAVIVVEEGREVERQVGVASRQKYERLILGRTVTPPDAPRTPGRSDAVSSDDPFAKSLGSTVPLSPPASAQTPGLPTLETRAAELAANVRRLTQQHGSQHPEVIVASQQLETTLSAALDLKLRFEQQQIAELEQRLGRLRTQLAQRQTAAKQIVDRRMRELLEEPGTEWDRSKPPVAASSQTKPTNSVSEVNSDARQPAIWDQIIVDLYATDGIYANQKLLNTVVVPLNRLSRVVTNVRMVPGDTGRFVFAVVRDPSQRFFRERRQTNQESATQQAVKAALNAGGIENIRWEAAAVEVKEETPSVSTQPADRPNRDVDRLQNRLDPLRKVEPGVPENLPSQPSAPAGTNPPDGAPRSAPAQETRPLDAPVLPPATEQPASKSVDTIPADPAPVPATPRR